VERWPSIKLSKKEKKKKMAILGKWDELWTDGKEKQNETNGGRCHDEKAGHDIHRCDGEKKSVWQKRRDKAS